MRHDSTRSSSQSRQTESGRSHRFVHQAMACTWEVFLLGQDECYADQAARAALDEIDRLEGELSRFIERSDISRLNALPVGRCLRLSPETFDCLVLADRVRVETDGAFDVTFGSGKRSRGFELDRPRQSIRVFEDGVRFDLGGIGKGFALDRAVAILREWSIENALIHCGQSTVYALGSAGGEEPRNEFRGSQNEGTRNEFRGSRRHAWTVELRNPADQTSSLGRVALRDQAFSGSGIFIHGRHIVNPRNGSLVENPLGAWAVAPSAAISDALSTAFMVMAPEEIEGYCRLHPDVSAWRCVEGVGDSVLCAYGAADRI